eukprot:g27791.t2
MPVGKAYLDSWKVLRLKEAPTQALISVGVGDFRNSSLGPYRELAIAVDDTSVSDQVQEIHLDCNSFLRCQEKLPACSHTFMLQSFTSSEAALQTARAAGITAAKSSRPTSAEELTGQVEIFRDEPLALHPSFQ